MATTDAPASGDTTTPGTPAERFEAERPRLVGLAYRMLGSRLDAEDMVQEAWLRFERAEPSTIDEPAAWLTTVVSRLAVDQLRSARHRREAYVGPWLPEFVHTDGGGAADDPEAAAELAESLTIGFLRVLETLSPLERVVFLLADVFDVPHAAIAEIVDRSPVATRQIASRARRKVREARPPDRPAVVPEHLDIEVGLIGQMVTALASGEVDQVLRLLAPDAVLISDGGALVKAARRPVVGADRVARFMLNLFNRGLNRLDAELTILNNRSGVVLSWFEVAFMAVVVETDGEQITAISIMRNPEKLAALDLTEPLG